MFYNYGTKRKKIIFLGRHYCTECKDFTNSYLVKEYFYFHLFSIPVIEYKKDYYIECEFCEIGRKIFRDDAKMIMIDYHSFPSEESLIKIMTDIKQWIYNGYIIETRESFIKKIDSLYHFNNKIEYLENLVDNICLVERGIMASKLCK